MRATSTLFVALFLAIPTALAIEYSPFLLPNSNPASSFNDLIHLDLFRRDSKCPNVCGMNNKACCPKNTNCALDGAGNIACCPKNAACTGNLGEAGGAAATAAPAAGSKTAAASGAAMTHAISGSSTVQNSFYPFPYLPTTYANAAQCTSSFSSCQLESAKCTGMLEGGGMAVTISGPAGGVTQQGAMPAASAESVCSSLSAEACHGLALTQCSTLGGAKQTAAGTFVAGGSANAAPTKCPLAYGMGLGVAAGIAVQVVR
ncbi:hypothetical protein ACLMJK_004133 [Lecanora helva]